MKTFYTIIKIAPNTLAGDMLSIGLLLHDGEQFWLRFSEERKTLAKRLLHTKPDSVDFLTKQIQLKVDEVNSLRSSTRNNLFGIDNLLSSERFAHISSYSNGIVRFTEPSFLNDRIDEGKFLSLFQLLVDKTEKKQRPESEETDIALKGIVQAKLISRVEHKVHTNLELAPNLIPGIYYNFHIDCLGKNGSLIGAKTIPFHKRYEAIDKELGHYFSLISLLEKREERKSNKDKFYILGEEPQDTSSREHRTWESLNKNPVIELLHPEESEKVAAEIEERKASKFLAEV